MSRSRVENGPFLEFPAKVREQHLVKVVYELIEITASGCCRYFRLLGVDQVAIEASRAIGDADP
jgi:hypothetical protein